MDISTWTTGWLYLSATYMVVEVSMALEVTLNYATWWTMMHPSPLGLDEMDSGSDGGMSPPSKEDQMNVDNSIHDGPPPAGGLEVLTMVAPALCK